MKETIKFIGAMPFGENLNFGRCQI